MVKHTFISPALPFFNSSISSPILFSSLSLSPITIEFFQDWPRDSLKEVFQLLKVPGMQSEVVVDALG